MIFNPVNGAFSISVPSEIFKLDTAVYDSVPIKATVALRKAPSFLFSGQAIAENPIDLDSYGEYPLKLNGEISHGDTTIYAATSAILFVSNNGPQLKADLAFNAQDFNIDFFQEFGIPEDQMWLEMEFQLLRN